MTEVLPRERLVAAIGARMLREEMPRLTILVALLLAGGFAFLTSMLWLSAGVKAMALRYPLAALAGYLAFIVLIRLWIAIRRHAIGPEDVPDPYGVGRVGGESVSYPGRPSDSPLRDGLFHALDLDEGWWVVAALLLLVTSATVIAYVIYIAPLMLAEIALDAALVSTLYGRLRSQDRGHWAGALLRYTWKPAVLLIASMAVVGFAMQLVAPGADSIGDVVARFT